MTPFPKPPGYEFLIPILQSSETTPGSRMALQPHPRSTIPQSRAHGSPPPPLAEHRPSGSDADPFENEGRGTPRDTTEGLDQARSQTTPIPTTAQTTVRVVLSSIPRPPPPSPPLCLALQPYHHREAARRNQTRSKDPIPRAGLREGVEDVECRAL